MDKGRERERERGHRVSPTGLKYKRRKSERERMNERTDRERDRRKSERERLGERWVSAKAVHTEQTSARV